MFNCRACLWQCISALTHDAPLASRGISRRAPVFTSRFGQLYSTAATTWRNSPQAAALKRKTRKGLTLTTQPQKDETDEIGRKIGVRPPGVSYQDWSNRKRELKYLADPLELADFVKKELGKVKDKEKFEDMLLLVRMASNSMNAVVSWNHIINHLLHHGRIGTAVKVYNEVRNLHRMRLVLG